MKFIVIIPARQRICDGPSGFDGAFVVSKTLLDIDWPAKIQ